MGPKQASDLLTFEGIPSSLWFLAHSRHLLAARIGFFTYASCHVRSDGDMARTGDVMAHTLKQTVIGFR